MSIPRAALLAAALITAPLPPSAAFTASAAEHRAGEGGGVDFDCDGRADLAVAAPYADAGGAARSGAVRVLYGMRQVRELTQDTPGVPDAAELGDAFGAALAAGDFDGDGCHDLAVGASEEFAGERRPGRDGDGVVHLFHGSRAGLRPGTTVDATDFGARPLGDRFGAALAAGDLDGDGDDELVIGAPGHGRGGAVGVYGQRGRKPYLLTQRTRWIGQKAAVTDRFGAALAAGDFDGDGRAEIAVGAPGDTVRRKGQGSVTVLDPRRRRALLITQSSPGIAGADENWDEVGAALAAGDFDGDGRDDLAIGAPGEGLTGDQRAMDHGDGMIHVVYGTPGGLRTADAESWSQNTLKGRPRYFDRFGSALAAGDLDGDGCAELAVGAPGENAAHILRGTRGGGLTRAGNLLLTGKGGGFGAALAIVPAEDRGAGLVVAAPRAGRLVLFRPDGGRAGVALPTGPDASLYGYAMAP